MKDCEIRSYFNYVSLYNIKAIESEISGQVLQKIKNFENT